MSTSYSTDKIFALKDQEKVLWSGASSQWRNARTFTFLASICCAIVIFAYINSNAWMLFLLPYPVFRFAFEWYRTRQSRFMLTDMRIIYGIGVFTRIKAEIELTRIVDHCIEQNWYYKALDLGDIRLSVQRNRDSEPALHAIAKAEQVGELISRAVKQAKQNINR